MATNKSFEDEFISLSELLGENRSSLTQNLGRPDDVDENEHRTFVIYEKNHAFFRISNNKVSGIQMPIADSFGRHYETTDEYYTFKGLQIGMSKEEVLNVWGEPKSKGSIRWNLGKIAIENGNNINVAINFSEKSEDDYFLSSFSADLVEKLPFDQNFLAICNCIGSDEMEIINSLGKPDKVTTSSDGNSKYLAYGDNDALVRISLNLGYADYVISPMKLTDAKIMNGYFNLHGIQLGDTKDKVFQVWGNPTTAGDRVWVYGDRTGTTSNGKRFETHLSFVDDRLEDFEGMMIKSNTQSSKSKSGCFIATACYGDYNSEEVLVLREFRDNVLLNSLVGRVFVKFYYLISPPIANIIEKSSILKTFIRNWFLSPIIRNLKK